MVAFGRRRDAGRGYMAHSERVGPAVLVLHEFFGLQPSFRAYADRLNADGFTVLAADLYDGALAANVEEAGSLAQSLDLDRTFAMLEAAAAFLTDNWHPLLGIVGFSLGADFAVELAARRAPEALVLYYGLGDLGTASWTGPTLGHFAETDEWVVLDDARAAFDALPDAELHVYPGAGHWFANSSVPGAYDEAAAAAAFERTSEFLHHHVA